MRIAIAGQTYLPPINGQAVFSIHLAEGLVRAGHQVLVLMPSDRARAYATVRNGVQIHALTSVPLAPLYSEICVTPLPRARAGRILDAFQPDVVHLQDYYPLCRGVLRAALKRRLPLVGTNHFLPENMLPHLPRLIQGRRFTEPLLWKLVCQVLGRVDFVTTPTETAAAVLRQQRLPTPVRAISCGVDLDRFRPDPTVDRAEVRRRYGLDPRRTVFLYVGRVDPEKGLDILLRAFAQLGRDDLQLAIAGCGRHLQALQSLAEALRLDGQAVFTGYVPDADLPRLLNSSDIFVMPSAAELESIATLEAMGTGRPLLVAGARALPELVDDGVNGCLFRAGDVADAAQGIEELAARRPAWPRMGEASRRKVQPRRLQNTVRAYEALYYAVRCARPRRG